MKKFLPIFLIWFAFFSSLVDLLARLQLIHFMSLRELEGLVAVVYLMCAVMLWVKFRDFHAQIENSIVGWDEELKKDIDQFLKVRKNRLFTGFFLIVGFFYGLYILSFFSFEGSIKTFLDVLFYVYLVILFHISLVSTLIFAKLNRTYNWADRENRISELEEK